LRELRHTEARAAGEATEWLLALQRQRKSPRTIVQYSRTVDALLAMFPETAPEDFTDLQLERFVDTYPQGSRLIRKAHISSLFKWWESKDIIPKNPVLRMDPIPAPPRPIVEVFDAIEVDKLCSLPSPDGVLMRVMTDMGVRKNEASHLRVNDFNLPELFAEIRPEGAKGGKGRLVPLTQRLAGALDHWFTTDGMEPDDYLWYCRPGASYRDHSRPIASSTFYRWWAECLDAVRVPYKKPHTTRHTFATTARRQGIPIDEIQRILGHEKIATTVEMYVHMSVADLIPSMRLLEADHLSQT
jgi:integrase